MIKKYNGKRIFSILDIANSLSQPKYFIKNKLVKYQFTESFKYGNTKYFDRISVELFLDYLLIEDKLSQLKNKLQLWKTEKIN